MQAYDYAKSKHQQQCSSSGSGAPSAPAPPVPVLRLGMLLEDTPHRRVDIKVYPKKKYAFGEVYEEAMLIVS